MSQRVARMRVHDNASSMRSRHTPRKRGIQYSTGFSHRAETPRRTGSSAFADDDNPDSIFKQPQPQLRDLAACAREFCWERPAHLNIRGRRECRAHDAPAASRAKCKKHTSIVTTVTPESPGIPYAMVLTVSFVLSPVTGLVCHRHRLSSPT